MQANLGSVLQLCLIVKGEQCPDTQSKIQGDSVARGPKLLSMKSVYNNTQLISG